ncbi:hypothetical protein CYMTET_33034, partial [Cymbomonas tetramitiformis]
GRVSAAQLMAHRSVLEAQDEFGEVHWEVAWSLELLGSIYLACQDKESAIDLLAEALRMNYDLLGAGEQAGPGGQGSLKELQAKVVEAYEQGEGSPDDLLLYLQATDLYLEDYELASAAHLDAIEDFLAFLLTLPVAGCAGWCLAYKLPMWAFFKQTKSQKSAKRIAAGSSQEALARSGNGTWCTSGKAGFFAWADDTSASAETVPVHAPHVLGKRNTSERPQPPPVASSGDAGGAVLICYTDGSCKANRDVARTNPPAGWGLVVLRGAEGSEDARAELLGELWGPVEKDRASPYFLGAEVGSNNTGELSAIGEAFLWILENDRTPTPIDADSLASGFPSRLRDSITETLAAPLRISPGSSAQSLAAGFHYLSSGISEDLRAAFLRASSL